MVWYVTGTSWRLSCRSEWHLRHKVADWDHISMGWTCMSVPRPWHDQTRPASLYESAWWQTWQSVHCDLSSRRVVPRSLAPHCGAWCRCVRVPATPRFCREECRYQAASRLKCTHSKGQQWSHRHPQWRSCQSCCRRRCTWRICGCLQLCR